MTNAPLDDDGIGRPPSGSEIEIVELIRARRAAETEAAAYRKRLFAMQFSSIGLVGMVRAYREELKRA